MAGGLNRTEQSDFGRIGSTVPRLTERGEWEIQPIVDRHQGHEWAESVETFLSSKRLSSSVGEGWITRMRWELMRVPGLQRALGQAPVGSPNDLSVDHLRALREKQNWEKSTLALHFAALRQFLKWSHNPLADEPRYWRLPAGQPSHRRWLTKSQLLQLYHRSHGRQRLLVALEALNGLRRVEVLRLRARDVLFDEGCLRVLGKGQNGGKWRKIPLHPVVGRVLRPFIQGRPPDDRILAISRSGADQLLQAAVRASGLMTAKVRVSHHDLRRTFGRLSHEAGMDLVQLKNLFGHTSLEMTVHYIGLDADEMRSGLQKLGRHLGLEHGKGRRR